MDWHGDAICEHWSLGKRRLIGTQRSLSWRDGGQTLGPVLGGGRLGFRQMAPLVAEYENLVVGGHPRLTLASFFARRLGRLGVLG